MEERTGNDGRRDEALPSQWRRRLTSMVTTELRDSISSNSVSISSSSSTSSVSLPLKNSTASSSSMFDAQSSICLLTIMTLERVASLHRMLGAWDGHVSLALLLDSYEEQVDEGMALLRYRGRPPPSGERITLTLVEDRGYRKPHNRFPYNVLRNAALRGCTAEYVMAADVDFVPFPPRP